jgi:hypothetical protein
MQACLCSEAVKNHFEEVLSGICPAEKPGHGSANPAG